MCCVTKLNMFASSFVCAASLSSDLPSVMSPSSSQIGATTADKGPSPEMEALTATQQGMLHAVSLHTSAPHSVLSVGGESVHVCTFTWSSVLEWIDTSLH